MLKHRNRHKIHYKIHLAEHGGISANIKTRLATIRYRLALLFMKADRIVRMLLMKHAYYFFNFLTIYVYLSYHNMRSHFGVASFKKRSFRKLNRVRAKTNL